MAPGLDFEVHGNGPRLALVHGFTQNRRCWGEFADRLARRFEVLLVDAPGHGGSAGIHADVRRGARLIGEAVGPARYLGYSMGGRHTLRLALDQPELVERLVLIGASPGIADANERRARRRADDVMAAHLESIGVDSFIDEWLAQPIFASLPASAACADERRTNDAVGLAASLREAGTGAQQPLWDRLGDLRAPTLIVIGANDAKFGGIARAMQTAIGTAATIVEVPDAGHAPHLEQPDATAHIVAAWLDEER